LCALAVLWAGMAFRFKRRKQSEAPKRRGTLQNTKSAEPFPSPFHQPQPRYTRLSSVGSPTRPSPPATVPVQKKLTSPEPVHTPSKSFDRVKRESLSTDLRRRQRRSTSGVLRETGRGRPLAHQSIAVFSSDSEDKDDADAASVIPIAGVLGPGSVPSSLSSRVTRTTAASAQSAPILLEGQRKHRSHSQKSKRKVCGLATIVSLRLCRHCCRVSPVWPPDLTNVALVAQLRVKLHRRVGLQRSEDGVVMKTTIGFKKSR
jgi:hypothetical protein